MISGLLSALRGSSCKERHLLQPVDSFPRVRIFGSVSLNYSLTTSLVGLSTVSHLCLLVELLASLSC